MKVDYSLKNTAQYLGLTFLIAWFAEGIIIIANLSGKLKYGTAAGMTFVAVAGIAPAVSFYVLLKKQQCINNFKDYVKIIFANDSAIKTIIILCSFFLAHFMNGFLFGINLGNPAYLFVLYIPLMIIGGGLEELGWRGYLQPALETRLYLPLATILTGIIWAVWHLPLWFIAGSSQSNVNFLIFTAYCVWSSFMHNGIRKLTNCIFACVLFHAWTNVMGSMFIMSGIKVFIAYLTEAVIVFIISCYYPRLKLKNGRYQKATGTAHTAKTLGEIAGQNLL